MATDPTDAPLPDDHPPGCTQVPRLSDTQGNPDTQGTHQAPRHPLVTQEPSENHARARTREGSTLDTMPLARFIPIAAQKNREALRYADGWMGVSFTFTRYLKGHPDLAGLDAVEAAEVVDQLLTERYPEAEDPWVELLGDRDSRGQDCEPFESFVESFQSFHERAGQLPKNLALTRQPKGLRTRRNDQSSSAP